MKHLSRVRISSGWLALSACIAIAGPVLEAKADPVFSIEQGYYATFWNYPVQPPNPADPVTLVAGTASRDYLSTPFDDTYTGVGRDGLGAYSVRVAANSDYGHLRAALQTSFDHYSGSNYLTGYYQGSDWQISVGGNPYVAQLSTYVRDGVLVTGGSGLYDATFNFVMHGNVGSSFGFNSSNGTPIPVATGDMGLVGFGPNPDGGAIPLLENRVFDGDILSITVRGLQFGSWQQLIYWMDLAQFTPSTYDQSIVMTGAVNFDLLSTAALDTIIITVPNGTDVSNLDARFASGTQHPVVFQPGLVPEPSAYAMLLAGFGLLGFAVRRREQKAA